ncbi:MAG TPA: S-methyl-5'-thioadenosine phosphorylase [Phycisphaerae bacterium]|nr:S-methyl-5'-thioadenosine phosphorylase [Phycisphaerae bacterium]
MMIGLIGGSGLGHALLQEVKGQERRFSTPFGEPSSAIIMADWEGAKIAFLPRHGPGHTIPPTAVPYRANIYALKSVGVTHIIASGATGSLREEIRPRDLVVVDQVIDKTTQRASSFFDEQGIAAHAEFSEPFCPTLRKALLAAGEALELTIHDGGTYVCMEGPAFSTVAESRMHRSWGGDLIGMTCMPEAKLAREAEICYAMLALPTDYDCWRPHEPGVDKRALLAEILHNMEAATENSIRLIRSAVRSLVSIPPPACACQSALELAIWTAKKQASPAAISRLGPIVARYFAT